MNYHPMNNMDKAMDFNHVCQSTGRNTDARNGHVVLLRTPVFQSSEVSYMWLVVNTMIPISGTILPIYYNRSLGALELLLVNQVIYRASCLKERLLYIPGLQKHWIIESDAQLPNAIGFLRRNTSASTQESLANNPLDWYLVQLLIKPDD